METEIRWLLSLKLNCVVNIVQCLVMSELIAATSGREYGDDKSHTFPPFICIVLQADARPVLNEM